MIGRSGNRQNVASGSRGSVHAHREPVRREVSVVSPTDCAAIGTETKPLAATASWPAVDPRNV